MALDSLQQSDWNSFTKYVICAVLTAIFLAYYASNYPGLRALFRALSDTFHALALVVLEFIVASFEFLCSNVLHVIFNPFHVFISMPHVIIGVAVLIAATTGAIVLHAVLGALTLVHKTFTLLSSLVFSVGAWFIIVLERLNLHSIAQVVSSVWNKCKEATNKVLNFVSETVLQPLANCCKAAVQSVVTVCESVGNAVKNLAFSVWSWFSGENMHERRETKLNE